MKNFTIGEIADLLHLNIETLYYYDRKGMLPFVKRDQNNHRQFTVDDLEMILNILHLKNAEVPLKEIKKFIQWRMIGDTTLSQRLHFIEQQEVRLNEHLQELQHAMQILEFKKWYYQTAVDAGTEAIHLKDHSFQYNEQTKEKFLAMVDQMSPEEKLLFAIEQQIATDSDKPTDNDEQSTEE